MLAVKTPLSTTLKSPREIFEAEMGHAFPGSYFAVPDCPHLDRKVPIENRFLRATVAGQAQGERIQINSLYALDNLIEPDRRRALHGYMIHEDTIHVIAVAHARRRPGYWKTRS